MRDNRIVAGNLIDIARGLPPDTEVAQLSEAADFQLHLARIEADRPFYVICAKDVVLSQLAGTGIVRFQLGNVRAHRMRPGDTVYVPAGTPHRYRPDTTTIQLRYKAATPGLEAAAWYCDRCATELYRHTFAPSSTPVETGYRNGQDRFDAEQARHTCPACGLAWSSPDSVSAR